MSYSLKNIRLHAGMDGQGFNASLYRDGKKIAHAFNEGSGGETMIHYDAPSERALLEAHCKGLPKHRCAFDGDDGQPYMMAISPDLLIDLLIEDYQLARDLAKMIKGKISFITIDKKIYSMKGEMSEKARSYILNKYPGAQIFNDLPQAESFALLRSACY